MSKELSVLVAAYDDSDSAQHEYSVLKEELPKTGLVMDRSKVIVLATSDAPNEIGTEHTGGGPIGTVVERAAGKALKGRLAPGTAMIVGVIEPAVEGQASAAMAQARGRAIVPVEQEDGDGETRKEAVQAAVGMAMAQVMEQWVHPSASASAIRSLAAANQE